MNNLLHFTPRRGLDHIEGLHPPYPHHQRIEFTDDGQPDAPRFFQGLLAAIVLGGSVGLVVVFVALLTMWRFGL